MHKPFLFFVCLISSIAYAQDKLVKYDNTELLVRVIEISDSVISYKRWDNQSGPIYKVSKSSFAVIIFENGKTEVLSQPPKTPKDFITELKEGRKHNISRRNSIGFDFFSLLPGFSSMTIMDGSLSSFGFFYEHRPGKQFMAHQVNLYVQYLGETAGTFYASYQPKFFFQNNKIIRGFGGLDAGVGYFNSNRKYNYYEQYSRSLPRGKDLTLHIAPTFGMNIYPNERLFILTDFSIGGRMMVLNQSNNSYPIFWRIRFGLGVNF